MSITYTEARSIGLKAYFTGKLCPKGHLSERWTSTRECCECVRQRNAKKYRDNPTEGARRARETYKRTRERRIEGVKRWLAQNPDWVEARKPRNNELARIRYRANPEAKIAAKKKWLKDNPDKASAILKRSNVKWRKERNAWQRNRNAKVKNSIGSHTAGDIELIRNAQRDKCAMPDCRCDLTSKGHVDHIMPISRGGSNWPRNLQLLCGSCNHQKHSKDPLDFARKRGLLL